MRRNKLSRLILLLIIAISHTGFLGAQNALYVPNVSFSAGLRQELSINLRNSSEITAFQFDIKLPDGMSIGSIINDDEETVLDINLTSRKKSSHSLNSESLGGGLYRAIVISMNNQAFRDNDGAIVNLGITTSSTLKTGDYNICLSNIHIVPIENGVPSARIDQPDYNVTIHVDNKSQSDVPMAVLSVSTTELQAGKAHQSIGIALTNSIEVTAFQFDISLPAGITINDYADDNDEVSPDIRLTSRKKSSHTLSANRRNDGSYTVVVLSMSNQAFRDSEGDVVTLDVDVPITMQGNYNIKLDNIHIVPLVNGSQGIRIDQDPYNRNITINNNGGSPELPTGDNIIFLPDVSIRPGGSGVVSVNMTNHDEICSFQFNLYLPDGISIVKEYNEDDEYIEAISLSDRKKSSHNISFKQTEDGGYFILAYSLANATFKGNDGAIINIKVKADEDMPEKDYGMVVSNILMVTPDERKIEPQNHCGTLTISSAGGMDDINQDTSINIYNERGIIYIVGLSNPSIIDIFDISGMTIFSTNCNNDTIAIDCSRYNNSVIVVRVLTTTLEIKVAKIKL